MSIHTGIGRDDGSKNVDFLQTPKLNISLIISKFATNFAAKTVYKNISSQHTFLVLVGPIITLSELKNVLI